MPVGFFNHVMDAILTATHFLALLFWVRLWSQPDHEFYFNPFLSAPTRLTDRVIDFFKPVLPLPGKLMALLILGFLLVFRTVAIHYFNPDWNWPIRLGEFLVFTPKTEGLDGLLIFGFLNFLFFIVRFWGVYLLIQLLTPVLRRDRASEVFHVAALPLSALRKWAQVLLLVVTQALLIYEMNIFGVMHVTIAPEISSLAGMSSFTMAINQCHDFPLLYHGWLAAISIADSLQAAVSCLMVFLIGGFVAFFLHNQLMLVVCNEGVSVLMGRFSRRTQVGMMDFTPLIAIIALRILYSLVVVTLCSSLHLMLQFLQGGS